MPEEDSATSSLHSLPDAVLREVISWSPDAATANALLDTSRSGHRLRHDPAAAALLLIRHPSCPDSKAALASCSSACPGGAAAAVRQLLQLLRAGPESGGPFAAPAPLLHAMLCSASGTGDVPSVEALLALPQPPDVDAQNGAALRAALTGGPQLAAMEALLGGGAADPCVSGMTLLWAAAAGAPPHATSALRLLLLHCPPASRADALITAVEAAIEVAEAATLQWLLAQVDDPSGAQTQHCASMAAGSGGGPAILQLLLDHRAYTVAELNIFLNVAATAGRAACAGLLLDVGADVRHDDNRPLLRAVRGHLGHQNSAEERACRRDTVALLLRRGAVATPAVHRASGAAGRDDLMALLQQAAAAPVAAPPAAPPAAPAAASATAPATATSGG